MPSTSPALPRFICVSACFDDDDDDDYCSSSYYYFTDEETGAWRGEVTCPRGQPGSENPGLELEKSGSRVRPRSETAPWQSLMLTGEPGNQWPGSYVMEIRLCAPTMSNTFS